ncbi:MAG TPA: D-glucuronyl C5-epimerase family protein [Polyangiaceae bacterium]|nr:D-glucuronyl C5-epimerase family protein [Polyangiaceae bacterium]
MRGLAVLVVAVLAAVFAGRADAATLTKLEQQAFAKVKHAPLDAQTRTAARTEIARAAHLVRTLPNGRGYHVQVALEEAATFPGALTMPRALALYGALRANDDYFAKHWAPPDKTDIVGADGVVYRYFSGHCFRFHPLADFGVLNARVASGDAGGARTLADALIERGVYQKGGGIGWEYDFPFMGGRAPWLSGMAQAVAAQAFAGAASLVTDRSTAYMREAAAAYNLIPRKLLTTVAAGPWIRLYSFTKLAVLNADLQATISLQAYAQASQDASAQALATRMQNAAASMLPRFDTGYWSYYALPNEPSPVDYHTFVVQLLTKLAKTDPRFVDAAARFKAYEHEPPAFELANGGVGQVRFWLSKPATVRATTNAGPSKTLSLLQGWHTLTWTPKAAGVYPVHIAATDWLGNKTQFDAPPVVHVGGKPAAAAKVPAGANAPPDVQPQPFAAAQRVAITWPDAATAPDPTTVASITTPFLELDYATPPTSAFAQYAASLAQQLPNLRYLALGPAPNADTALQYVQTLAAVDSAVKLVRPDVAIGALVDGSATPKTTVAALRKASVSADFVWFRAAATTANQSWTAPNWSLLTQAFGGTLPPLLLDAPTDAAVTAAACDSRIAGVTLSAPPDTAVGNAVRGAVICPGATPNVATTAVTYPPSVTSGVPATLQLGCVRDCLYVVTLVGANQHAIVATRGSLTGGAAPTTVTLPKTTLGQSSYTLDVRLVNRVNPGASLNLTSPPLAVGPS